MAPPPPPRRPPPPRKKKKGAVKEADEEQVFARARGALLGLAVGDALGATHEGRRYPAPLFPELCGGIYDEMMGRGPFNLKPGQVTDETQLATVLATGLKERKRYDLIETAKDYARWMPLAFDVDPDTKAALSLLVDGRTGEHSGRRYWMETRPRPASNNALGRTAPIGVFFYKDQARRIEASTLDAAITHFDPRCQLGCVIINAVIAACIYSPNEKATPDEISKQIEADLSIAAAQLGRVHPDVIIQVTDSVEWLREDVRLARQSDPQLYGPDLHLLHHEKYVRVALRLALWELFHAPNFEQALIDVVNRGGDADTNAAITGALYGAWVGEAAIPSKWNEPVMEVFRDMPGPLAQTYHPKNLVLLAGTPVDAEAKSARPEPEVLRNVIKG